MQSQFVYSEACCEAYIFFQAFVSRRDLGGIRVWMERVTSFNWLADLGRLCCYNILNSVLTSVVTNILIPVEVRTFIGRNKWISSCWTRILMPQTFPVETWWAEVCRYWKAIVFVAALSGSKELTIYTAGEKNGGIEIQNGGFQFLSLSAWRI